MHIRSARMAIPFIQRVCLRRPSRAVVLKDAKVAHGVAFGADRSEKLQLAVKQCLAPLGVASAHAEYTVSQG